MHLEGYSLKLGDIGSGFEDLGLNYLRSFEMKWQQIYRGSRLYIGWMMRGVTLIYGDSLSP